MPMDQRASGDEEGVERHQPRRLLRTLDVGHFVLDQRIEHLAVGEDAVLPVVRHAPVRPEERAGARERPRRETRDALIEAVRPVFREQLVVLKTKDCVETSVLSIGHGREVVGMVVEELKRADLPLRSPAISGSTPR